MLDVKKQVENIAAALLKAKEDFSLELEQLKKVTNVFTLQSFLVRCKRQILHCTPHLADGIYGHDSVFYLSVKDGQKHGAFTSCWDNGLPKFSGVYKNGVRHGAFFNYNDAGRLVLVREFSEGVKNGLSIYYSPESLFAKREDLYEQGKLLSTKFFNPDGSISKATLYID